MFFNFLMPTIERFEYILMVFNVIKAENIFSNAMTMTSSNISKIVKLIDDY